MSDQNVLWKRPVTRRKFLTLGVAAAGLATGSYLFWKDGFTLTSFSGETAVDEKIVRTSGSHNCGGRCLIQVHVRDGRIVRISTEDDIPDTPQKPQLRGCLRCRSYRERLYHPDRLKYPMKRVGKRGEGNFERITWDEALDTIAGHTQRIRQQYGPDGIYIQYGWGNSGRVSERVWMERLLGLQGGYLSYYGNYSTACTHMATPYTYGTTNTGNNREDWLNSKVIILLGWNPAETIHGTNTTYYLKRAKAAGAKIITIDPIYSNTAISLADQWIPIRPTTDSALLDAMAYVMITEDLHDQKFLDQYCLGFDEDHMPPGIPAGNSYRSYVLGDSEDNTPKTPAWAEAITGIPQETIIQLAREYATNRPGALIEGYGPQRHAYGEQVVRSGIALAAMTGNVGVKGGWASGSGYQARGNFVASIPAANPHKAQISVFSWPDAIVRGKGMGSELSVKGARQLNSNIKLIFNLGGNCLVTQHADNNGTAKILADENLVEFLVVSEQFLTPSAKFADILLPADNMMERDDIVTPWGWGDYVLYMNKAVDTVFECRNGYDWISDLAGRLGLKEKFTEGRTLEQWLRYLVEETAKKNPGFPSYEEFTRNGVYRWEHKEPAIAFQKQIEDPQNNPFPTPSGKIEIFSSRLWDMKNPREIPAVPKYVPAWEGPEDPLRETYPLQCIGHHYKRRVHSVFDNVDWMEEAGRQEVWVNALDAAERGLNDGELVKVYNDRGIIVLPVKVTSRIMPGVASVPQGAWWMPDAEGVDRRGSINTLTKYHPTPLAFGNPTHTNLVQITRA
ncbi:molybdopterin-dependent oxidoreductase|uniref:Anaerobic dimethyl sulfoxide reductase subunit A n=1 Tax=Dendrosporobacter quercicolus TaxID=146817 RepID=A0A1G9NHT4_9FIRM|nr:DMSO/selenate family reductase complex A subunit [Dendrosporobacter quercicolus]NSL47330.1 molybdopterin-dependent oxidoreductase [Dendrosporobacter quercicolus DSM 1736]SDL85505.1 anaerobic dimethyl sulfoxide reductase subunit A [Dendrosporobacter quercicolus]